MTVLDPDEYGALFVFDLTAHELLSPRARQDDAGVIGVSHAYTCRERVRRLMVRDPVTDVPDKTAAIIGQYVDAGVKRARAAARPNLLHDVELTITLPSGLRLLGHADEIDPDEPSVCDLKTKDGLDLIRRMGADEQQRAQRHLYYYGALQAGIVSSDTGVVRNIFLDRSGKDGHPHVEQEPFSMDVVLAADEWFSDAAYAAQHGEETVKDWPLPRCQSWCQFYTACRGSEHVAEEHLTGYRAEILRELVEAKERERAAAAVAEQARGELLGVTGRSDRHWVKTTTVNGKSGPYAKVDCGVNAA